LQGEIISGEITAGLSCSAAAAIKKGRGGCRDPCRFVLKLQTGGVTAFFHELVVVNLKSRLEVRD